MATSFSLKFLLILSVLAILVFASKGDLRRINQSQNLPAPTPNGLDGSTWGVSYINAQADAFLHGQLHLLITPDAHLAELSDPYDPATNAPYRMHDASFFNSKYFLYWSPLPAIVLSIPFKLLTGHFPSDSLMILVIYALTVFGLLKTIGLNKFESSPSSERIKITMFTLIVFNPALLYALASPAIYVITSFFACAASVWGFYFFYKQRTSSQGRGFHILAWLLISIAITIRPTLAIPAGIFMIFAYLPIDRKKIDIIGLTFGMLVASLVLALQAFYNFERFQSPSEFGLTWQLSGWNQPKTKMILDASREGLHLALRSFDAYLFRQPDFNSGFPFITSSPAAIRTDRPYIYTQNIGFLMQVLPFVILCVCCIPRFWTTLKTDINFRQSGWFAAAGFGAVCALCVFPASQFRYQLDFVGLLLPAVGFCIFAITSVMKQRGLLEGRLMNLFFLFQPIWTVVMGVACGFSGDWNWGRFH